MKRSVLCVIFLSLLGLAFVAAFAPAVHAQQRPRLTIDEVRVGFPRGLEPGEPADERGKPTVFKAGFWTPVYVYCTVGPEDIASGRVIVEATDTDDVQNTYTVPLPRGGVPANQPFMVVAYTKPGSAGPDLNVTVQADDRSYEMKKSFSAIEPGDVLYLGIGARLAGMRKALARPEDQAMAGTTICGFLDHDIHDLPDRWFGYAGVDLVVLTTGQPDFIQELLNERQNRKEALAEWVRRGGRLVISTGRHQVLVPELLRRLGMDLPVVIREPMQVPSLDAVQTWLQQRAALSNKPAADGRPVPVEIARLEKKPGREWEQLVPAQESDPSPPLLVRVPYGLGQVIVAGFDLDQPPFSTWPGQADFWKRIQDRTRTRPSGLNPVKTYGNSYTESPDLSGLLISDLENFPDVSVISFGWVALLILIYIVIVGPVDYLVLKKVFGRLELTWITFPTIVALVSIGAYYAAYALKGNDLRINKVDLVDIDPRTQRAYGTSWFTIFSPRIQTYTIGLEPAYGEALTAQPAEAKPSSVAMSWLGRPDVGYGGYGRAHSQSLFRRTYEYAPDAAGLQSVPIQVWATKSFTANWEQPTAAGNPLFSSDLRRWANSATIEGSIINRLPVPLEDVSLIVPEGKTESSIKVYGLGTLEPGVSRRLARGAGATTLGPWLQNAAVNGASSPGIQGLVKGMMFFDLAPGQNQVRDTALHYLDQSWRWRNLGEAVLVGRVKSADAQASAEQVVADPATPARLWLGALPTPGATRPALAGTISQKVFVRVFLPIQTETAETSGKS